MERSRTLVESEQAGVVADPKGSITSIDGLIATGPMPGQWYRGQPDIEDPPLPTVLRPGVVERLKPHQLGAYPTSADERIFEEFRRLSASLLPNPSTHVDAYFIGQHHGLPTRLLDWSTNVLAAVYFAVASLAESDGVVFVLRPRYQFAGGGGTGPHDPPPVRGAVTEDDIHLRLIVDGVARLPGRFREAKGSLHASVPVLARLRHARMVQQGSCFTLHPQDYLRSAQYRHFPIGHLLEYRIPADAKRRLFEQLHHVGVTESTLFPDLDHIVDDVRREFGLG
jgi:hypothetical protein